ncbi:MAG: alpha/beta hydrolase [Pseudomonadota bacterium]
MDTAALHPEIRDAIVKLPRLPFASRVLLPVARTIYDFASRSKVLDGVEVSSISTGENDLVMYRRTANPTDAGVLWIYGGGYLAGKPEHLNRLASQVALETGATVFVPRYRLAPRNPFPAAFEDCKSAWLWLVDNAATLGIDNNRLAIGGNSAGGGLAANLANWARDGSRLQPVAQILFYPMLDDRTAGDRSLDDLGNFIWDNKANHAAWSAYLSPHQPGSESLPKDAAAARCEELGDLPPTWIGICSLDLFADEDERYAQRLQDAGVTCLVEREDGVPHAFEAICPDAEISQAFVGSAIAFLKDALE